MLPPFLLKDGYPDFPRKHTLKKTHINHPVTTKEFLTCLARHKSKSTFLKKKQLLSIAQKRVVRVWPNLTLSFPKLNT